MSSHTVGADFLGFSSKEVGTHLMRSSLAMMMCLAKEQTYTIIFTWKWSLDAFLAYIEKQVKKFTKGVSSRMLPKDTFFNGPHAPLLQEGLSNNNKSFQRSNRNIFGFRQAGSLRHQLREQN